MPLEFNVTSKGLAVAGSTNSATELMSFVERLEALSILLAPPLREMTAADIGVAPNQAVSG